MQNFSDKVAVITGAASGIGAGLAQGAARRGMRLLLADVSNEPLQQQCELLRATGASCTAQATDVGDPEQVKALAERCLQEYGGIDLLCNNAGVMLTGQSWELNLDKWQWLMNVNLNGVINGLNSFVPIMLQQGREAHIVNTGSLASFLPAPFMAPYTVSKYAVRALTETLQYELLAKDPDIGVSLLCPGQVATGIMSSDDDADKSNQDMEQFRDYLKTGIADGLAPTEVADMVFKAVEEKRFWIYPHPEFKPAYEALAKAAVAEENPGYDKLEL